MQQQQEQAKVVAVTGASGYIAGQVIKALLEEPGKYRVKGSVRSLADPTKVAHLRQLFPALELFEADLVNEGSFDTPFQGCDYVLHTASPFQLTVKDPQRDLIDPAVNGTLNVLRAAAKAETVKRVVVTSSVAAITTQAVPPPDKVWTEADWNLDSTIENAPYRLSKRLAEEAAWNFVKELNKEREGASKPKLELVTLCPAFVLGPPLSSRTDGESVRAVKGFLTGDFKESGTKPLCFGIVDIRDVARAHVNAIEKNEAVGNRYLLSSNEGYSMLELAQMIRDEEDLSEFRDQLPDKQVGEFAYRPKLSHAKAEKELGIEFKPVKQSVVDMARALISLGIVTPPSK